MSDDAKRPLLALFAHPDDEFAVFPWLQAAAHSGRDIHCIWLTDGGFGGQDIQRRNRESMRVLRRLGVDTAGMHFVGASWNVPDGGLHLSLDDVVPRLVAKFGYLAPTAELLIPAWEGGHQDHDAAHLGGLALAAAGTKLRQYSLYHGNGLSGPWFRVLSPLQANGRLDVIKTTFLERLGHARRCLAYASQWRSFLGLLPFYLLRMLRADAFALQPVDPARTAVRPHEGFLLYERRGGPTWHEFAARTQKYRLATNGPINAS
jgi:LmbE family N-acetylglucosaminyl deacetylase